MQKNTSKNTRQLALKKISNTKIEIRILFGAQQTEGEMLFKGQGNEEV